MNFEDLDKLLYTAGVITQLNEGSIKAYLNSDAVGDDDGRDFGVEIYKKGTDDVEYEFFTTEEEALARVKQINSLNTDDWGSLSEARIDHPDIEYKTSPAKGDITKITADMSSYMGGAWTRLNRNFVKLKTESIRLATLLKEVNLEITDKMQRDTFDPADELLTREVMTKDAIFMLSKAYTQTTVKMSAKDREAMMNNMPRELVARLDFLTEEMIPDLTKAIALTIEAYSKEVTTDAKPRLTPKLRTPIPKDKYQDATKESINEDSSKLNRFNDMINKFISQYDKKLDYITDV